jgi:hypothetical protein
MSITGERMSIINRPYQHETDYKKVSEFLINHYLPGNADGNWLEPEWEYANFHPMLDQDHMHLWRIWEDDGEMVAFTHYEWRMGECFMQFHPNYRYLREELLDYTEKFLTGISSKDGR